MLHPTNQLTLVVACALLCGCSDGSSARPLSTATLPPTSTVQANGEREFPGSQPGIGEAVDPDEPLTESSDSAEELRAEEMLSVASAKARAFSQRVLAMQSQFNELFSKQFANETVLDRFRKETRRRQGMNKGSGANSRRSGEVAGVDKLVDEGKKLDSASELVQRKFETVLQEETWKRLTPAEQVLIAKYDLIPKQVRESVGADSAAPIGSDPPSRPTAENKSKLPESWQVVSLEGTPYELAFPEMPQILKGPDSIAYIGRDRDRAFVFRRFLDNPVPENVTNEDALENQVAASLEGTLKNGIPVAVRTAHLGDLPARVICNYFLRDGRERVHLNCVTIIGREVAVVEVLNLEVSEEPLAQLFFDSFRRRSTAPEE